MRARGLIPLTLSYLLFTAAPSCSCDDEPWYVAEYMEPDSDAVGLPGEVDDTVRAMSSLHQAGDGNADLSGTVDGEYAWIYFEDGESLQQGCFSYCGEYDHPYRSTYRVSDMSPQFGAWSEGWADLSGPYLHVRWTDGAGTPRTATWYVADMQYFYEHPEDTATDTGAR